MRTTVAFSPRLIAIVVGLVVVALGVAWWALSDDSDRMKPRRKVTSGFVSQDVPQVVEVASEQLPAPPVVIDEISAKNEAMAAAVVPVVRVVPEVPLDLESVTEVRIELPVVLTAGTVPIGHQYGVDGKIVPLPSLLHELVRRSGWDDPGFWLRIPGTAPICLLANNRLHSMESVITKESLSRSQWGIVVAWAHGLQPALNQNAASPLIAAENSPITILPRMRTEMADFRPVVVLDDETDPEPLPPITPSLTGIVALPTAIFGARTERRRQKRANREEILPDLQRLVVSLAPFSMEITTLDAPGMVVGFGMLQHSALEGSLPMDAPKVEVDGAWTKNPALEGSRDPESVVVQHQDRFMWFVWRDASRLNAINTKRLATEGTWRLWSLRDQLTPEYHFLSEKLPMPKEYHLGLDFGEIALRGTLLTIAPARSPSKLPLELADRPVGMEIVLSLQGPMRSKEEITRLKNAWMDTARRETGKRPVEQMTQSLRFSRPIHDMVVEPRDWEYTLFVTGEPEFIVAEAWIPERPGLRWRALKISPVAGGETRMDLVQSWKDSMFIKVRSEGVEVTEAAVVVAQVGTQGWNNQLIPPPRSPRESPASLQSFWRLDSVQYGTFRDWPFAPTLSDWEFMFGRGAVWLGNHETNVANNLRSEFLKYARGIEVRLQVSKEARNLLWREGGPRLAEEDLPLVGKDTVRNYQVLPLELPVFEVPEDAFLAAKQLSQWPMHFKLPSPIGEIEDIPPGSYPVGTRMCASNGYWVYVAHREKGFGFVFVPIGWNTDVTIDLYPWSNIGWDWKYIPKGHWPDGNPESYFPEPVPEPVAKPVSSTKKPPSKSTGSGQPSPAK